DDGVDEEDGVGQEILSLDPEQERLLVRQRYLEKIFNSPLVYVFAGMLVFGTALNVVVSSSLLSVIFGILALLGLAGIGFIVFATRRQAWQDVMQGKVAPLDTALRFKLNMLYEKEHLVGFPFLMFFSWLAILNLVGYSLAGEKMPWL